MESRAGGCLAQVRTLSRAIAVLALGLAGTVPMAVAQVLSPQLLTDLTLNRLYLWRGTPRVEGWTAYPALTLAAPVLGGSLSLGLWSAVELAFPEPHDFSITGSDWELAETDFSLQYAGRIGPIDATGGIIHYRLQNPSPLGAPGTPAAAGAPGPMFATTELYGGVTLREGPLRKIGLTPTVRFWQDVGAVDGLFADADVTVIVPLFPIDDPVGALYVTGRVAASLGQSVEDGATGYFEREGLAYTEMQITWTNTLLSRCRCLRLGASYHLLFGDDPATRIADPRSTAADRGHWGWLDVWVTWRLPERRW